MILWMGLLEGVLLGIKIKISYHFFNFHEMTFLSPSGHLRDALNHVEKEFLKSSYFGYGYQDIQDHGWEEGGQVLGHGFVNMHPIEV